ncbi:AI-2E family transporter [Methanohalophilus sp.]|uniref:AI-2E family transporter n=1 Tax=Methanohalophilus sp. TaxID=1966352 RepID=UPI00262B47E8|nr:AI-2E family transporter [Methanohalophilus sp.]
MSNKWKIIIALLLLILFLSLATILLPLGDGIVLGLVFAYICRPIYIKLKRWDHIGAFIATMFIVTPLVIIIGIGIVEIFRQFMFIVENQTEYIRILSDIVRQVVPEAYSAKVNEVIWSSSISILSFISQLGFISYARGIAMLMINLIVAIFVCYFLLQDGEQVYKSFIKIVPDELQDLMEEYLKELDTILGGIFIGNAYAALTVSTISVVVFYAFGLSHILALATLVFIASVIPFFAGYMILIALSIIRYFEFGLQSAIVFFIVSSIIIYAPPELFLRPYLVSLKSQIHPIVLMVVFLGGGFVGGVAGFFAAPMILGALIAAYRVYTNTETKESTFTEELSA